MRYLLSKRRVCLIDKEDRVSWCASSSGEYSVKLGYEILDSRMDDCFEAGDLCCNKEILPKAGTFAWLAIQGRILTGERRRRFGYQGPTKYFMCGMAEENVDHLLVNCEMVAKCWSHLQEKL